MSICEILAVEAFSKKSVNPHHILCNVVSKIPTHSLVSQKYSFDKTKNFANVHFFRYCPIN